MHYQLIIEGEIEGDGDAPDQLAAVVNDAVAAVRKFATANATIAIDEPTTPREATPIDFATEVVSVTIDLTDPPSPVVVSVRDGAVVALGLDVDAAMSAVATKAVQAIDAEPVTAEAEPAEVDRAP